MLPILAGLGALMLMGNPPKRKRRASKVACYRLADGDVVTVPQLRRMFMGKVPGPVHRRLLGITKCNPDATPAPVTSATPAMASVPIVASPAKTNPRRRTIIDPITGRRVRVKPIRVRAGGPTRSRRGGIPGVRGADGVWRRPNPLRPSRNGVLGSRRDAKLILEWHNGQGSAAYQCGSNWLSGKKVPADAVMECYNELVLALKLSEEGKHNSAKAHAQLRRLVSRLGRHYHPMALYSDNPRRRNAPLTKSQRRALLGILTSHSKRRRR